jgi:hypothetical protein
VLYGALDTRPINVPPFEIFARDLTIRGLALTALTSNDAKLAALKQFVSEGLAAGAFRRYPSDLTDEEWTLIGPLIPPAKKAVTSGRWM